MMLCKDGVLDAIRQNMWWFRADSGEPEAGNIVWYQHDGARPHTAAVNEKQWAMHGRKNKFDIRVVTQPAQSPDLNINDLAFFASLQTDVELVAKENVSDLVEAVEKSWEEFPPDRMAAVWRCLYGSFKGIIESNGGNEYSHHTGSRKAHRKSTKAGDKHDMSYPFEKIRAAAKVRDNMLTALETGADYVSSSEAESTD